MIRRLAAGLAVALVAAAAAAPAAAAPAGAVEPGAAQAYLHPDPGAALAGLQLLVRAGLDRQTDTQAGLAALAAEAVLRTPVDGVALVDAVAAGGGSLDYAIAPRYVRFYLQASPQALAELAPLVARALAAPAADGATLAAARTALGERIGADEGNPVTVGLGMLRASYYRAGPGQPALGTPSALSGLGPADVRGFHERWYVRAGAVLVEVGRTGAATAAAGRALAAALPAGPATPSPALATRAFSAQPRRLVTHRDVGAPYLVLGFAAPALGDRDFAPALVVEALLGDVLGHHGATTLPPQLRGFGALYGYDVRPAQFALWIDGAQIDPSTGLGALAAVLQAAQRKPLAAGILKRYKETARGAWRLRSLTLEDQAQSIGNAAAQGLEPALLDAIPAAIDAVGAADVERVAKRWFQHYDLALVLPRGGDGAATP